MGWQNINLCSYSIMKNCIHFHWKMFLHLWKPSFTEKSSPGFARFYQRNQNLISCTLYVCIQLVLCPFFDMQFLTCLQGKGNVHAWMTHDMHLSWVWAVYILMLISALVSGGSVWYVCINPRCYCTCCITIYEPGYYVSGIFNLTLYSSHCQINC